MDKMAKYLFFYVLIFIGVGCTGGRKTVRVEPRNDKVQTEGRIGWHGDIAEIYWPGSSFKIKFRGTSVKATLKDEAGHNYFNVIVDDSLVKALKIDTIQKTYELVSGLSDGPHTVEMAKRADWFRGKSWFYGFKLGSHATLLDIAPKKRMIEFYGNSITVGAAVEDYHGDSGDSTYTNNYESYAAITARHFNANYSCIASSGIGIMVSWSSLIMPEIYDHLDPGAPSPWDFSRATPDIVVINLFQNDCALVNMPDYPQFKRRFGDKPPTEDFIIDAYRHFVEGIRSHYPTAYIICVLGTMSAVKPGSVWPGYIEKAVAGLNDKRILAHFFPYKNSKGHPRVAEQKKMADELIGFIDEHIVW
jgi:hypothetical protein